MAKKRARKASTRVTEAKPFSTKDVTAAMEQALVDLREERKLHGSEWGFRQRNRAWGAEWGLKAAIHKCRCSSSSHSFP